MHQTFREFLIRDWQPSDRDPAAAVIRSVLTEYGLGWEPQGADQDVIDVETHYHSTGGEFWVIEQHNQILGTSAYYPIARGTQAAEIRKMYLVPQARGQGLGKFLLNELEAQINEKGYHQIWIETASVLTEAVHLYERNCYSPATGIETARCDRVYHKLLS